MAWIVCGIMLVLVSGCVGMVMDIKRNTEPRAFYWALGTICGWVGGTMAMVGISQLFTL